MWLVAACLAAGCSVAFPIAAATSDVPPDRTPVTDRIVLATIFGVMIDATILGVAWLVREMRR